MREISVYLTKIELSQTLSIKVLMDWGREQVAGFHHIVLFCIIFVSLGVIYWLVCSQIVIFWQQLFLDGKYSTEPFWKSLKQTSITIRCGNAYLSSLIQSVVGWLGLLVS